MKITVRKEDEVLKKLEKGLIVEGRLRQETGEDGKCEIIFAPYNRKPYIRPREAVICYLEHGRVTESPERIKMYESVPKRLGTAYVGRVFQREAKTASEELKVKSEK